MFNSDFLENLIGLFNLMLNVHSKQLRSSLDDQLLNHTVLGQASRRQSTSIRRPFLPVTDNLLFLNQQKSEIIFPRFWKVFIFALHYIR